MTTCDRPKCRNTTSGDALYCSDRCYQLDNDDLTQVTVRGQGGVSIYTRYTPTPVILPGSEAAQHLKAELDEFARACGALDPPADLRQAS